MQDGGHAPRGRPYTTDGLMGRWNMHEIRKDLRNSCTEEK